MKMLVFNWRDIKNPAAGGAEVFTHEIAKRLAAQGHEVTLFVAKFPGCKGEEMLDGVHVVREGGRYTVYMRARIRYRKEFRGKFDVVVDEINTLPFFTPKFVKGGERVFAILHQFAKEYWKYETRFPISIIGPFLEKRWLRNYKHVPLIVNESISEELRNMGFTKIFIKEEGTGMSPLEAIPQKEPAPTVLYLGRLTRAKRVDHLVRAFSLVKERVPGAKLWVAGDGYMRKNLESISGPDCSFFGRVSEQDKQNLLERAWVVVQPSILEGFSLVVIEANAKGTPAIAYDVPGLSTSIRNGETGILVENGNVRALADAVVKLVRDNGLRTRLSMNALAYAKRFNWDNAALVFSRIIEQNMST
jgi:glycosyltransferase involved in cell wall biosynthesis